MDRDGKYLETIARDNNLTDMLDLLSTFAGPRLRMIQEDSIRQSSLQSLSRDVVLTSLITNNSQERTKSLDQEGTEEMNEENL